MPRQGLEVVLRPDDVSPPQKLDHAGEAFGVVEDVVVPDHDALVAREPHPGEDPPDLAHRGDGAGVHGDVADGVTPEGGVRLEDPGRRAVRHDHLVHDLREAAQVVRELPGPLGGSAPDRDDVGRLDHDGRPPASGTRPTATTCPSQA
ncbi:hypothetical protein [Rubrobacter marinus]|uniref:hypothetical protein n=1 Tax=Rubrobacter marinus TaxID=2653852 RepID=UPI001A9DCC56|nr:hypothetical protein [Rubrobacter marinus]